MTRRRRSRRTGLLGRNSALVMVALLIAAGWWLQRGGTSAPPVVVASDSSTSGPVSVDLPLPPSTSLPAFLPEEAQATLALIAQGGPFPHPQDGAVFGNREGLLPRHPRGFYREYTVPTPGLSHRGARRIVTGGKPPRIYYYTDDHYQSFRSFELDR